MMDLRAVHRYSHALYLLAEAQHQLDAIDDQLIAVRELVEKHREIAHLVSNSTIALGEKEDFIGKVVPAGTLPLLVNFLKVLIKKRRFKELPAIQEEFHRFYERKQRIEEVIIISAVPLSEENNAKLATTLNKKFNYNVRLTPKVDPDMIGGLILRFGGQEINASFRSRLDALRQLLTA
jgi:F-type H+-transporting ATPase subunit delta